MEAGITCLVLGAVRLYLGAGPPNLLSIKARRGSPVRDAINSAPSRDHPLLISSFLIVSISKPQYNTAPVRPQSFLSRESRRTRTGAEIDYMRLLRLAQVARSLDLP